MSPGSQGGIDMFIFKRSTLGVLAGLIVAAAPLLLQLQF
jgi:hypothetical protein